MSSGFYQNLCVTVFDGERPSYEVQLASVGKDVISFGRQSDCDIVLTSEYASRIHGCIYMQDGKCYIEDMNSTNGLLYHGKRAKRVHVTDGDYIRIIAQKKDAAKGVLFVFSVQKQEQKWVKYDLSQLASKERITLGRDETNDICLKHVSISHKHAEVMRYGSDFILRDLNSTNGVYVNGKKIHDKVKLRDKDFILISHTRIIYANGTLSYVCARNGISVQVKNVQKRVGKHKDITICDHVNLRIAPGELVAIIGGSGAGKSTLMNCISGYSKPTAGEVLVNEVGLYQNFDMLKHIIGYVPQQDIVYDNLTVESMLYYSAKLRLPKDVKEEELHAIVDKVIDTVELTERKDTFVRNLSGGQRKRASIAVELLTDPKLFFLDEPASGLDPGTERSLIRTLKGMTVSGKTVILVTHSTLNLDMYDKIVFMGTGGKLCFSGTYQEALAFFRTEDIVDVYEMISKHAGFWQSRYAEKVNVQNTSGGSSDSEKIKKTSKKGFVRQFGVLSARYIKLMLNDRQRMLLLLLQAPLLAYLITLVANGKEFEQYEVTKSLLFALSCCGFWIGILSSIQEICKERNILKREYMTGLNLCSYILSKVVVLGLLCLIQTLLIVTTFTVLLKYPGEGICMPAYLEYCMTTWGTAMAAAAMGLFVSSLFSNADRAMTVAPILLMPQILFSGVIFNLEDATEVVSYLTVCRWSMEGYGSTANLNDLKLKMQDQGFEIVHKAEDFFTHNLQHILTVWGILLLFIVGFSVASGLVLRRLRKV
jgi:ABC-type multidrug transport system ATPase subunit/pSer/pThr/pTyr-binding forkhead associated (FHA) protein